MFKLTGKEVLNLTNVTDLLHKLLDRYCEVFISVPVNITFS